MTASPKPPRCRDTVNYHGPLVVAELRRRAAAYAACLVDGDEIHSDIDWAIAAFRDYLPEAIADRGMTMTIRLEGKATITTVHLDTKGQAA